MQHTNEKQTQSANPYEIDVRLTFDWQIKEDELCMVLEDMRLGLQSNYPKVQVQIIGDDTICSHKLPQTGQEQGKQVVTS